MFWVVRASAAVPDLGWSRRPAWPRAGCVAGGEERFVWAAAWGGMLVRVSWPAFCAVSREWV